MRAISAEVIKDASVDSSAISLIAYSGLYFKNTEYVAIPGIIGRTLSVKKATAKLSKFKKFKEIENLILISQEKRLYALH